MNCANEITGKIDIPTLIGNVRLILGLLMMISGFYFGLFSAGASESLGLVSLIASPFVMVTDK